MQQAAENMEQEIEISTEGETKEVEVIATQDQHEQEIEQYSEKVQKRIDKLTYNQREAERQRDEAVRVAETLNNKVKEYEEKAERSDDALFREYNGRVVTELEQAKEQMKKAVELGDVDAQINAQQNIAKLAVEQETLSRAQKQRERAVETNSKKISPPPIDPRATAWAQKKENSWFGRDRAMTAAAFEIDKEMQETGISPIATDYYEQLDTRLKEAFPHKFEQEEAKFPPVQAVGRTSVGTNPTTRKSRKVKLTASQQAIAKKLGVPLEEYAKYV